MSILVTGASGALGRRTVEELLARGATDIVATTTRNPDGLADLADRGIEVRRADFDDPASLPAAFAGAARALIISTDAVDGTDLRRRQHRAAIDAAAAAGVGHLLYTSFLNARPSNPAAVTQDHMATEEALAASGVRWTALRNNSYADFVLQVIAPALASGTIYAAAGDGAVSYVTREDCARAAAAALLAPDLAVGPVDITGPEAISYEHLAAIATEVFGRQIAYVPVDADAAISGMVAAGLPAPVAALLVSFDLAAAAGELATVSSAVADLTGTPPQSLAAFLEANSDALGRR